MKNNNFKVNNYYTVANTMIAFFISIFPLITLKSQEQELKKEIHIPFPENISIDESILLEKRKTKIVSEQKAQKNFISIPFPNDETKSKNEELKLKKEETEKPIAGESKSDAAKDIELPLEKLIVFPKIEIPNPIPLEPKKLEGVILTPPVTVKEEIKPKTIVEEKKIISPEKKETSNEVKATNNIGKALLSKDKQDVTPASKSSVKRPSSKLDLGDYASEELAKLPAKETVPRKASVKIQPETSSPNAANLPITKLPNLENGSQKKGKDKKKSDESVAPFERSRYYLNRNDKSSATPELNSATSGDSETSNLAKMDQIRLLALDRRKNEAKNIIEGISDSEFRLKGLYELAVGLENSAKGDKKLKEEAIPFHLTIITEAPKKNPILPKSLWALSHLLFTIGDHTPALDHLSDIILNHSNTEFADEAIYLSGRIYEESTSIRNLNRAKKYYELFLKNADKPAFKNSIYLSFVKKRLALLEN